MASAEETRRAGVVLIRDDQIASINPALQTAQAAVEAGELGAVYPIYILDDETIADTRPSLCRLHYLFFRLWRLGERIRQQGGRLEFRQGDIGYQLAQYADELNAEKVYYTTDETTLGKRQTERIQRQVSNCELVEVPAEKGLMQKEHEEFVPYWELFSEEELEVMGL